MVSMCFLSRMVQDLQPQICLSNLSENDTETVVHVQPVSSASRRNLLAPTRPAAEWARSVAVPARPVAVPLRPAAAPGDNIIWRNFRVIEENPNREKCLVGDTGPSRQANAANSPTEHFNLFIDENVIESFCLETNRYANQMVLLVFKMLG